MDRDKGHGRAKTRNRKASPSSDCELMPLACRKQAVSRHYLVSSVGLSPPVLPLSSLYFAPVTSHFMPSRILWPRPASTSPHTRRARAVAPVSTNSSLISVSDSMRVPGYSLPHTCNGSQCAEQATARGGVVCGKSYPYNGRVRDRVRTRPSAYSHGCAARPPLSAMYACVCASPKVT